MTEEQKRYIEVIEERDAYKRAFEAALRWLDRDVKRDIESWSTKDETYSDEYKMDLDDMRAARRRLESR